MAETKLMTVDDPNSPRSPCSRADRSGIQTTMRVSKVCGDQHHDSLHKVLQKATTSPSLKNHSWPHAQLSSRTAPQNLFLEGFRDCASEVMRFLTEEEKVDDNNPLLMGLQSHLVNVSRVICHETIVDLDKHDADIERQQAERNMNASLPLHSQGTLLSPDSASPIVSKSVNSSVSDSSAVESDISMSVSSFTDSGQQSFSSENASLVPNNPVEIPSENHGVSGDPDDVFDNVFSNARNSPCSTYSSVLPLSHLARAALLKADRFQQYVVQHAASPLQATCSNELPGFTTTTANNCFEHRTPLDIGLPLQYYLPLGHSSPIPHHTISSLQSLSTIPPQPHSVTSYTETYTIPSLKSPQSSTLFGSLVEPSYSQSLQPQFPHQQRGEQTGDGIIPQHQIVPFDGASATLCESQGQRASPSSEPLSHLSSILELKANFLPGIDTSSVASGSFADILLAVESCQHHEDPRVRALAEELIRLIHNDSEEEDIDDDDEDDDDDFDNENQDVGMRNVNGIHRDNDEESGIEMMDESLDWGSAVDMIEQ